jgi:hypothetical protein
MGPNQSVTEYNVDFQQALTDLAGHVIDEHVKIEKYRAGLQHELKTVVQGFSNRCPLGSVARSDAVCNAAVASGAGAHCQE